MHLYPRTFGKNDAMSIVGRMTAHGQAPLLTPPLLLLDSEGMTRNDLTMANTSIRNLDKSEQLLAITSPETSSDTFKLLWYITQTCNYDCSYCADELHTNKKLFPEDEAIEHALDNLLKLEHQRIEVSISGGEPFLYSGMPKLLRRLKHLENKSVEVNVTSNGSINNQAFTESAEFLDDLTLSLHSLAMTNESYKKKFQFIQSKMSFDPEVNLMFLPGTLKLTQEAFAWLQSNGFRPQPRRIRKKNTRHFLEYSKPELDWLESMYTSISTEHNNVRALFKGSDGNEFETDININEITARGLNQMQGWNCSAGSSTATAWYDGELYSCEASVMNKKSFGNIYSKSCQWLNENRSARPIMDRLKEHLCDLVKTKTFHYFYKRDYMFFCDFCIANDGAEKWARHHWELVWLIGNLSTALNDTGVKKGNSVAAPMKFAHDTQRIIAEFCGLDTVLGPLQREVLEMRDLIAALLKKQFLCMHPTRMGWFLKVRRTAIREPWEGEWREIGYL